MKGLSRFPLEWLAGKEEDRKRLLCSFFGGWEREKERRAEMEREERVRDGQADVHHPRQPTTTTCGIIEDSMYSMYYPLHVGLWHHQNHQGLLELR